MEQITLKVQTRDTGKQIAKKLRMGGLVPGIFYQKGLDNLAIASNPLALRPIVYTKVTHIVNLEVEGTDKKYECVLKEVKFDPVSDKILHFDLVGLSDSKMTFEVPILLKGQSIGVKLGGVLQHAVHKVKVKCFPKELPAQLDVDITNLQIGKSIYLKDVMVEGLEFENDPETVIVSIVHSRVTASKAADQK